MAVRAGFPSRGSLVLMEELHRRIFEDEEFGYWRTHPYFTDRVARARAAAGEIPMQPDSTEEEAYRRDLGRRLSILAGSVLDEPTAIFVQRSALRAAFGSESSLEVEHDLLRMRAARMGMRKPILRAYGPLIADYDSLQARASRRSAASDFLAGLRAERDSLHQRRRDSCDRVNSMCLQVPSSLVA